MLGLHGYDHGSLYRRGITYVKYRHENINGPYSFKDRGHWYYLKSDMERSLLYICLAMVLLTDIVI
jgi:hypothetical protein